MNSLPELVLTGDINHILELANIIFCTALCSITYPSIGHIEGMLRPVSWTTHHRVSEWSDDDRDDRQVVYDGIVKGTGHLAKSRLRAYRPIVVLYPREGVNGVCDLKRDLDGCLSSPVKIFIVGVCGTSSFCPLKMTMRFRGSGVSQTVTPVPPILTSKAMMNISGPLIRRFQNEVPRSWRNIGETSPTPCSGTLATIRHIRSLVIQMSGHADRVGRYIFRELWVSNFLC